MTTVIPCFLADISELIITLTGVIGQEKTLPKGFCRHISKATGIFRRGNADPILLECI
ncbi:MAG: hypothetical protein K1060chlam4_00415 [Candidatus Anoxychlamydiales bacterium]|nr:hypothetical protein [Candidatus Anoxychlamydiales bacterium]